METGEPEDGMLPDNLRPVGKSSNVEVCRNSKTGQQERHFRAKIGVRGGAQWTPESDLPPVMVSLYDLRCKRNHSFSFRDAQDDEGLESNRENEMRQKEQL